MPNLIVDVNSWIRSACYPRSTFYPLSDGPSMRNRRITRTHFRVWSTCRSLSEATFCPYARQPVSIRLEVTFARLRYSLGGDRPSQTARQTLSPTRFHGPRLECSIEQDGISTTAPSRLAPKLHSLPSILHSSIKNPMPSCSKGSRGLSVLSRVAGIFTHFSISLSARQRQRTSRYAIRAGRNLPDKEFRYLRTVIVTAAVYWGFNSRLAPLLLTFQHRAGVRPYTSPYGFAESCVFGKQSLVPLLCYSVTLQVCTLHATRVYLFPKLR